jgi:hypothetical protein
MKKIYKYGIIAIAALTTFTSCDNYLDVNTDPNNPTSETVKPEIVLAGAEVYTYANLAGRMNQLGNLMMNNWTRDVGASNSSYYFNEHTYNVTSGFYTPIFEQLMLRTSNFTYIEKTPLAGYDNYKAIAKILKSYYFQYLVDLYGDIPYSQAHLRENNLAPAYDNDIDIYRDLVVQIDAALSLIENAPSTAILPGNNDVILHGDMGKWVKFANTLKLRILLRESKRTASSAYVATKIGEMETSGAAFLGAGDNVTINPGFTTGVDQQNPFAALFLDTSNDPLNNYSATAATKYTIEYLTNSNDDRRDRIYSLSSGGTYAGHQQGDILDASTNYPVSHIGPGLLINSSQDGYMFTAAESLLLQAEAVQRGYLSGSAQNLYESAITQSYLFLGLTATQASDYYTQSVSLIGWNASAGNEIEAIINQKWIALNGINGIETWIENTRTGFPAHVPLSTVAPGSSRPIRLLYPNSEIGGNTANVPSQVSGDAFTSKIFWNE